MFADNTNLFFSHSDINVLFEKKRIKSLRLQSLRISKLKINGLIVERESSIRSLRVTIDENLTLRDHIHTVENKVTRKVL